MKLDDRNLQLKAIEQRQRDFDSNPRNLKFAYKYFRELNRNQKYQTVVRLYGNYEAEYRTSSDRSATQKV